MCEAAFGKENCGERSRSEPPSAGALNGLSLRGIARQRETCLRIGMWAPARTGLAGVIPCWVGRFKLLHHRNGAPRAEDCAKIVRRGENRGAGSDPCSAFQNAYMSIGCQEKGWAASMARAH